MEFTLLWSVLTGVALLWVGTLIWRDGLPDHAFDSLIGSAVLGLLVGRLVAMALQGVSPITHPLDVVVVRGGVHTGAASLAAIVAIAWMWRDEPAHLDAAAPAVLLGLAGWQAGCLWRGACLGSTSSLPWAWSTETGAVARHPVELYAAIALVLGAWLVSRLEWRPLFRAGSALAIAGLARLVTQPLRPSLSGGPVVWYWTALVLGAVTAIAGHRLMSGRATSSPT